MRSFYVPSIGDTIKLAEDWTFSLFPESRNVDLGAYFNHYLYTYSGKWLDANELPPMREKDFEIKLSNSSGISMEEWLKRMEDAERADEKASKWKEEERQWTKKANILWKPIVVVTLPAGTELKIDRIYIKKGQSDYNSITFYMKNTKAIKVKSYWWSKERAKKSLRFWAKLDDYKNIKFEEGE